MISEILSTVSSVASIIDTQMKKAERGEAVETAVLAAASKELMAVNEKLMQFKNAAESVSTDTEFAKLVRDSFTRAESN